MVKVQRRTEGGDAPSSTPRRTVRAVGAPAKRRDERRAGSPVRLVHGGVQYREYLNEEQRSQPRGPQRGSRVGVEEGCPAREVVLDRRARATSVESASSR